MPLHLPLPLPYDLISLVSDHQKIKAWKDHQRIQRCNLEQLKECIQAWPLEKSSFGGFFIIKSIYFELSTKWRNSLENYDTMQRTSHCNIPIASID
jgi:hypothetical protein